VNHATHQQFHSLENWTIEHRDELYSILGSEELILFGEWMAAKHSVSYDYLPDTFIAFDIWDINEKRFYSRMRFYEALEGTNINTVQVISCGREDLAIDRLLLIVQEQSNYSTNQKREGIVVRIDEKEGDWLIDKAKIVRGDFIAGNSHWTKGLITFNKVKLKPS
jgi:atypical dual specificity phosphatase